MRCIRLTLSGEKSFEKVEIFDYAKQLDMGIPQLFGGSPRSRDAEKPQLAFRTHEGLFICDPEDVILIYLDRGRPRRPVGHRVKRISVKDIVFSDVHIIPETVDALEAGFPNVLGEDQFSFYTKEGRYVCHDLRCVLVQVK